MENLNIEAIDPEFNQSSEFDFQYFEISGYKTLPVDSLISTLSLFADKSRSESKPNSEVTLFFYRKKLAANYKDILYKSAEENEFGGLINHDEDLIGKVWYKKTDGMEIQNVTLFENGKPNNKAVFKR